MTQSQANKCFKSVSASKAKQVYNDRKRKATDDAKYKGKQKRKESDNSLQDHRDYSRYDNKGPNAREVSSDISNSNLHELMIKYFNAQVTVTEASAEEINMSTIEQGSNRRWHSERRNRITSSNVGQIAKRKSSTKVAATVKKLLHSNFCGNKATEWGIEQEETSREEYKEQKPTTLADYSVVQCGLVVCVQHPWLATSSDGLVYDPHQRT